MRFDRMTLKSQEALQEAQGLADSRGNPEWSRSISGSPCSASRTEKLPSSPEKADGPAAVFSPGPEKIPNRRHG